MLRHLVALIPGERAPQLGGQGGDRLGKRVRDPLRLGSLECDELQVARLALDQGRDRRRAPAVSDQKIALPVAWDGAVFDLRGAQSAMIALLAR